MALKRSLNFWTLLLLSVNSIIGTGIFFTPGIAAGIAGPSSIISWVIGATISVLIALCFAELVSIYPKAGGVYEYAKRVYGKGVGFLTGWTAWIVANVAIAMLVVGGLDYLSSIFYIPATIKLISGLLFVLAINTISFKGIELSAKVLVGFAWITLFVVFAFIFIGAPHVNLSYIKDISNFDTTKIFAAVFLIMETFFGIESVTYLSEEVKNPKRNMPKVLIISTLMIAILSVMVAFISLTILPWQTLAHSKAPLLEVLNAVANEKIAKAIAGLIFVNIMGAAAAWIVVTPRLIYAMAKDEMIPKSLSEVHPKYKTPYKAIIAQTALTLLILLSGSFRLLLGVLMPLAIFMYGTVILAVAKLRLDKPNLEREFKMPFGVALPLLTVSIMIASMIVGTTAKEILLGLVLVLLGLPFYIIASLGYQRKFTKWFNNQIAWITEKTYKWLVLDYISPHIINYLVDPTVFKVIDLGCGTGELTEEIAKKAIPLEGKVYGIDFAKKEIERARKRKIKEDISNLEYYVADIYKLRSNKRLWKKLKNADAVVGIGILEYLPNPKKALEIANKLLRKDGKVYFVDYDYIGKMFDKPWVEKNEEILKMFKEAGFRVKIWRQKRLLWQYVHIYGYKEKDLKKRKSSKKHGKNI